MPPGKHNDAEAVFPRYPSSTRHNTYPSSIHAFSLSPVPTQEVEKTGFLRLFIFIFFFFFFGQDQYFLLKS